MASAVIRTYERKPGFSRNNSMKKPHNSLNGYGLDAIPPERSYTSETVADSSEIRRARSKVTTGPCVAQNFTTISAEAPSETASEDSCSLKRKSMSLNGDKARENYGIGGSLRDLSRSERKQLRKRLKQDLHQVRSLTSKIEAREMQIRSYLQGSGVYYRSGMNGSTANGPYFPSTADLHREGRVSRQPSLVIPEHSFDGMNPMGKDKRTPKANQLYASSDFLSGKEKLPPPEKNKSRPGLNAKRSLQGRMDSRDPKRTKMMGFSYSKRVGELLKQCGVLLKKLMSHKFGWVFNEPVDVVKLNLHDYFKIIKRPMDLGTIKRKLDSGVYLLPTEFRDDVRLTFSNAMKYNPQGHDVYHMADTLRGMFESKWKTMEEKVNELDSINERFVDLNSRDHHMGSVEQSIPPPVVSQLPSQVNKPASARKPRPPSAGKSASRPKSKPVSQMRRPMTFAEKQQLSEALGNLPPEKLDQAVQIMRKNPNLQQTDDEIEVDIESFDPETLWELHRFVMDCKGAIETADIIAPQAHHGTSEQQTSNGVSKPVKPTSKGNEAGEEDIDIGDDMPAKVFPPVVIEKDKGLNTKEGSSSSSSSGSGSSSSDSDSGSSSGSESDADEAHSAGAASKFSPADKEAESALPCGMSPPPLQEPVGSAAVGDRRGSPTLAEDGVKRPLDTADDDNPASKSSGSDLGPQSEGKGEACHERQARAALLRSRFAETILKAQEKTLPLSKTDNPENLRKEQEELERRRKEEKARLHAEARAVELQRKKAELAAAAEAKQRREAEREAARLALQNMEKTVEIDESMEVLKDLERLRSGPPEHIPSSGDETSPVHSPGPLSSFAFEGSNPLERLGLFMRSDEEEEQEEEQEVDLALAPHSSS